MALASMTGFARADGVVDAYAWSWEIKSLNGKGLDLRLRLPPGWDAVEVAARTRIKVLSRGTVHANLTVKREGAAPAVRVNEGVLEALLTTMRDLEGRITAQPATIDGILGIKGVVEIAEETESEDERRAAEQEVLAGFDAALMALTAMRRDEGAALQRILTARLDELATLSARAEASPGRQPEAIRQRLAEQVAALMDSPIRFDQDRLHQEAILLAAKADVREELDRLAAHIDQARRLLEEGGAVGRRLDFLAQELNREVNTLCAKSNDVELTKIGLELKNVVEQFREQVQNLE
jgi:uncharacterized protein (TIGR00255 family)